MRPPQMQTDKKNKIRALFKELRSGGVPEEGKRDSEITSEKKSGEALRQNALSKVFPDGGGMDEAGREKAKKQKRRLEEVLKEKLGNMRP